MLKRHLKMVMGMLCCVPAVFALTGAMQPGHAEILDYDEYAVQQSAVSDGLFVLDAETAVLTGDAVLESGQISIDETGSVAYCFTAEADCAYQLEITYRSIEGKRNDVEYAVMVDGGIPFSEASKLKMRRVWKSAGPITQTNQGDDIVPEQVLAAESCVHLVQDSDGLYAEPFLFRFAPGEHTLTLDFARAGIIIEQVRLVPAQTVATYANYIAQYDGASTGAQKYEAELTWRTSSPALAPIYDKSSAATTPSSPVNLRLNTIGAYNWEDTGLWVEWEITVPEDGLYDLAFRYRQSLSEGFFSSRKITVDGALPYQELADIRFEYVVALERQESIYPADYVKLRFLENHDRSRMAFLFPDRKVRMNWLAWMFFQKGMALLYGGQEWECVHRPGLFDADPVPMEGPAPLEKVLKKLIAMKKDELFSEGVYAMNACPMDILVSSWAKGGRKAWGIFSLRGNAGVVSIPLADGCYHNLLDDTKVWVEGGMLQTTGDPVILMGDVC